jgi:hypothetical protein
MRGLSIVFLCVAISAIASAEEPNWCSVSSRDPSNTLVYAPIAAAAQVQGEARARIIYKPNGRVEKVEPLSGVPMLLMPLTDQLSKWTVRSKASGDELCQTLVIATFTLRGRPRYKKHWKDKIKFTTEPNTVQISISRPPPEIETDSIGAARQGF